MKRNTLAVGLVLVLVLVAVPSIVWALPGGTWNTGIKIQNLSETDVADIIVTLYDPGTGNVAYTLDKTANGDPLQASANGSVELYMPSYGSVGSGQYAAAVSSSQQIGVVATQTDYDYGLADSYNGTDGFAQVYVPYVYHGHNHWSTEIFVQNTSDAEANVHAEISNGTVTQTYNRVIPANGMASFDTAQTEFDALGAGFIGAAVITSDEDAPLAVMVNESRVAGAGDTKGNVLVSFRGLSGSADAGNLLVLPSLYREFSGASGTWRSGIKVQNISASEVATVTVKLTADPDSPTGVFTKTLGPVAIDSNGGSTEFYLKNYSVPDMFKGSAVVESTGGEVVAMVIHTNYDATGGYGVANGYLGIAGGSAHLSVPSLYKGWLSGAGHWVSGIKIQNLSQTEASIVTVNFKNDPDAPDPTWVGTASGISLNPGESTELYLASPILDGGGTVPDMFKGSASITGVGGELAGTVIHTNYGRHVANMYLIIAK